MKRALFSILAIGAIAISSCSKEPQTVQQTDPPQTPKAWKWWAAGQAITFIGKDSSDVLVSSGFDPFSSYYGRFMHGVDSININTYGHNENVAVIQSASVGYNLTGYYDTVEVHLLKNSNVWKALYGKFRWTANGREFMQLKFLSPITILNQTYTDSL